MSAAFDAGTADRRRALPSIDRLLRHDSAQALVDAHGRAPVVEMLREMLQEHRTSGTPLAEIDDGAVLASCAQRLANEDRPSLRPVFNLSGTVLHTNLGRACLPEAAARAALMAMTCATNLEFDIETGRRGERDDHVEDLLCRLTGAEAATVVNNNASAVMLLLNTVAARREVVVSRGELVEIGGAFRVPDVMQRAGCKLHEVGTTNRTHLRDYEAAFGPRTAAFMKVHASNYVVEGFTAEVPQRELGELARSKGIPFLIDLGSGSLIDLAMFGLPPEPTPRAAIADGAGAVTFSGDKLLGGPQCGIIVGSRDLVKRMRANPLKRALRVDKIILAALEATLRLYLDPERARREVPTLRWLTRPRDDIRAQALRLLPAFEAALREKANAKVEVVDCMSQIGSGARPVDLLPSAGLAIAPQDRQWSAADFAAAFRALPMPAIGRVHKGVFHLDLRCLDDEAALLAQLPRLVMRKAAK
ncbi:L-seryl-tRNA(Sec) selenium transferase [Ramlibacter sp.]|uniref:L-seryl-tRNA(Sec) selenium transferase n=1 Tax=Ramlibacter sp. TaxID=1917967 RepID=UPI003D144C0C